MAAVAVLPFLAGPWRAKARRRLIAFIASLVSIGVLTIPMLLVSLHGSKTGWLPSPHLRDIYNLFLTISAHSKLYLLVLFACLSLGLLASFLVYSPQHKHFLIPIVLIN